MALKKFVAFAALPFVEIRNCVAAGELVTQARESPFSTKVAP